MPRAINIQGPENVSGSFFDSTNNLIMLAAAAPVVWTGSDADESKAGSSGNDTLRGAGGNDILRGVQGDDLLEGGRR